MSATEIVIEGAVTEDGRLVFDGKPDLPAGRGSACGHFEQEQNPTGT